MLKRKLMESLSSWKNGAEKKCLMIRGARQVGKTWLVREFGRQYENYVELNFIENPDYRQIFSSALDIRSLLLNLSTYIPSVKMVPGKTLILLDEIQDCPEALVSLKFWKEDGRFDVIATGSTLGIDLKTSVSYPVGSVQEIDMYSMDFEEFLWARGISQDVVETLRTCYLSRSIVPKPIHERMLRYLREYMVIGGMPEAVQTFVDTMDMKKTDDVQRQIYADYIHNIAHYAPPEIRVRTERCYRSVPIQLSKENHKFQYKIVEKGSTSTKYESCLDWLEKAYMITFVHRVETVAFPLESQKDTEHFRVYPTDIGLLMAAFPYMVKGALLQDETIEHAAVNLSIGTAKGGMYEALAADMLVKRGYKDLVFLKDEKSTREIEFFITNEDGIIPVEIKAGRNKANSLGRLLEMPLIPYGYKMSSQNVGVVGKKITMPLYMMMFL